MNLSDRRTKPNCGEHQSTISSASRDRWVAQIAAAASTSSTKSRSATASSELRIGRVEAELLRRRVAVDRKGGAGERRGPSGHSLSRRRASAKRPAVAGQHLDIGEAMMAEGHGLGRLEMGEARHDGRGMRRAPWRRAPAAARASRHRAHRWCRARYSRKSTATWSLRDRAVWSRPAGPPISSLSRDSIFMWMSSSAREKVNGPPRSRIAPVPGRVIISAASCLG